MATARNQRHTRPRAIVGKQRVIRASLSAEQGELNNPFGTARNLNRVSTTPSCAGQPCRGRTRSSSFTSLRSMEPDRRYPKDHCRRANPATGQRHASTSNEHRVPTPCRSPICSRPPAIPRSPSPSARDSSLLPLHSRRLPPLSPRMNGLDDCELYPGSTREFADYIGCESARSPSDVSNRSESVVQDMWPVDLRLMWTLRTLS